MHGQGMLQMSLGPRASIPCFVKLRVGDENRILRSSKIRQVFFGSTTSASFVCGISCYLPSAHLSTVDAHAIGK